MNSGLFWWLVAPSLVAAILTYLRREWEHGAEPISTDFLKAIREKEARRTDSWTEQELLKIP